MILNFYAQIEMMIHDNFLTRENALRYFGGAICHKVGDWKTYVQHLEKDKNYEGMIKLVNNIYNSCLQVEITP